MLMQSLGPKAINQSLVYAAFSTLVLGAIVQLHYSYLYTSILGGSYPYNIAPSIPETFLLLCALAVLYMLTLRYWFSLILISAVYCSFMWASFFKIIVFEAPLFPRDLPRIYDLFLSRDSFLAVLPFAAGVLFLGTAVIVYAWKSSKPVTVNRRVRNWVVALALLVPIGSYQMLSVSPEYTTSLGKWSLVVKPWNPLTSALQSGFLLEYVTELGMINVDEIPDGYSKEKIEEIIEQYDLKRVPKILEPEKINLIVYLIEAFIDPKIMNVSTTSDPVPTFRFLMRGHSSGEVVSPVVGGGSANAEFELLTGMARRFVGHGAFPYVTYMQNDIPSLASELSEHGYHSVAMHAASLQYYNYPWAYERLGFDEWTTLWGAAGIELDVRGYMPSDAELVRAIIAKSQQRQPYFIFAFPNSTHHPWNYSGYDDSSLRVVGDYTLKQKAALDVYVNALSDADRAIKGLIDYFDRRPEKTVILVLGDHLPALHKLGNIQQSFPAQGLSYIDRLAALHSVNAVIWTNFDAAKKDFAVSMNMMPQILLETLGIESTKFLGLTKIAREEVGVLSKYIGKQDGGIQIKIPEEHAELVNDYRLLQYDWLQGSQYHKQLLETPALN